MDTPKRFSCTVMHPGRFPAYFLDPLNPPKIKVIAEIDTDKLSFISSPSSGQAKTLASEPFGNISNVTIQHLSIGAQRLELLRKSLIRYVVVATLLFIYMFVFQSRDFGYSILIALAGAIVSGPLFFLFNGGFSVKNDVIRFHFTPVKRGKAFYLEIEPTHKLELQQALLSAGLKLEENEGS